MKKFNLLSLILLFGILNQITAQIDNTFWFVVPEITWRHYTAGGEPTYFRIASHGDTVFVKAEMPALNLVLDEIMIPAGEASYIDITSFIRDNYNPAIPSSGDYNDFNCIESGLPGYQGVVSNRGIKITSRRYNTKNTNTDISVYCDRFNLNNKDIWTLKGRNALGTNFTVPFQNYAPNVNFPEPMALSAFDIVATADATEVTITPKAKLRHSGFLPYEKDIPFTIVLNAGESFSCVAMDRTIEAHLGGSTVSSNNPIAITIKDDSMRPNDDGGYDIAGDQLIPDNLAGYEYLVIRGELTEQEYVFVMATEEGTTHINCTNVGTLTLNNRGAIEKIQLNASGNIMDAIHIMADKKILVWHISGFGNEIGGSLIPSIEHCKGSKTAHIVRTSDTQSFFLDLSTTSPYLNDFSIYIDANFNGTYDLPSEVFKLDPAWFTQIPGTDWWYLSKSYNEFTSALTSPFGVGIIANSNTKITNSGRFHCGILEGNASGGCKYGYVTSFSADTSSASIGNLNRGIERYCYGDTIELKAQGGINYEWWYDGSNPEYNTFLTSQNIAAPLAQLKPATSIWEPYKVRIEKDCYSPGYQFDTLVVEVQVYAEVKASFDTIPISGPCSPINTYMVENNPQALTIYSWYIPNEYDTLIFTGTNYNDTLKFSNHGNNTVSYNLKLVANKNYMCYDSLTIPVKIKPHIAAKITAGEKTGCHEYITQAFQLAEPEGPFTNYIWEWGDGTIATSGKRPMDLDSVFYHTFHNTTIADTTFRVHVIILDSVNQCSDTTNSIDVFVPGIALANYQLSDKTGCSPMHVTFQNQSQGNVSYEWSFIDGNLSSPTIDATRNFSDTTLTYINNTAAPVNYFTKLKVIKENSDGSTCIDTFGPDTLTVYPDINAHFTFTEENSASCGETQLSFENLSYGATNYLWNFGNGYTSSNKNPSPISYENLSDSVQTIRLSLIASNSTCFDSLQTDFVLQPGIQLQISSTTIELYSMETGVFFTHMNKSVDSLAWFIDNTYFASNVNSWHHAFNNESEESEFHEIKVVALDTTNRYCIDMDSITITVLPFPYIDLGETINACQGDTVTITAPEGYLSYDWGIYGSEQAIKVTESGWYHVKVLTLQNTYQHDSIWVKYMEKPVGLLPADTSFCAGDTLFIIPELNNYEYSWTDANGAPTIQIKTPGTYTFSLTDSVGCSYNDSLIATNYPAYPLNFDEEIHVCANDTLILKVNPIYKSYLWNTLSDSSSTQITQSGTYFAHTVDSNECSYVDSIHVKFHPLPIFSLGTDMDKCLGESVLIKPDKYFTAYLWNTGDTTKQLIVNTSSTFILEVTDSLGCSNTDSIVVWFHDKPEVNLGNDIYVCADSLVVLSPGAYFNNYIWNDGSTNATLLATSSGTYSVIGVDSLGCNNSDTVQVFLYPLPSVNLGSDISACQGDAVFLYGPSNYAMYAWSTGESSQQIQVKNSGTYSVAITDTNSCTNSDTIYVAIHSLPQGILPNDTLTCQGDTLLLDAGNFEQFLWSDATKNQVLPVFEPGQYWVQFSDSNNCTSVDSVFAEFIPLPIASFIYSQNNAQISFRNLSENAQDFTWNFGDSTVYSAIENPVHAYTQNGLFNVILTARSAFCGYSLFTDSILISGLSLNNLPAGIQAYPNPVRESLIIESSANIRIKLYTLSGILLYDEEMADSRKLLSMEHLQSGVYLLQIELKDGIYFKKIIKE